MNKIRIVLISCVSGKEPFKAQCKDLYNSTLFKKTWAYVTKIEKPDGIYILSALYGLVRYDKVIEPYNKTLNDMSKEEALIWADKIKKQITETFVKDNRTLDDYEFIVFAGKNYYKDIYEFFPNIVLPLGKLPIGKRLGALTVALKTNKKINLEK